MSEKSCCPNHTVLIENPTRRLARILVLADRLATSPDDAPDAAEIAKLVQSLSSWISEGNEPPSQWLAGLNAWSSGADRAK